MKKALILAILILIVLAACSSNRARKNLPVEEKVLLADSLYAMGKYTRAATLYDEISFERRSAASAHALIRLGESYMAVNRLADARLRFEQFIRTFPEHSRIPDAYYLVGVSYFDESLPAQYDQTLTRASIEAFRNFMRRYPNDARYEDALSYVRRAQYKLIEKKYRNGYIYYMMRDYSSALMYFDEVIALGNTDDLDRMSLYYSTRLHLAQKNRAAALQAFNRLKAKYPDAKETGKLQTQFY